MRQNVAKLIEFRKLPKGKFQVNLNKGLCLLFRAEPQMKRRVCNKDAIKEQAPNQNPDYPSLSFSSNYSSVLQVNLVQFRLSL